jgi:excisionase family DNA binding protein
VSLLAALSSEAREELRRLVAVEVAAALAAREREPRKRWLTAEEAGVYLGCSRRALYQRIRRGRIPAAAIRYSGRSLLIDSLTLDRALECE